MQNGSSRRLTLAFLFLALLLAPALAQARPPVPNRDAGESAGGQEITDLGTDPTGRFTTAVVRYDGTRGLTGGGLLGGATGSSTARDVYRCDLGPAASTRAGEGCRGLNHASGTAGANAVQSVDVTSYTTSGGLQPVFVVGGPGNLVSFWHYSSDQPRWPPKTMEDPVVNVSVSPDGARIAVTTKGTTRPAKLTMLDAADGRTVWDTFVNSSQETPADPTSLSFSRDGRVLVVGTTRGLLFVDPYGLRPANAKAMSPVDTEGAVVQVELTRNGGALVAGTTAGVYYIPLVGYRPAGSLWNRGVPGGVTDAAVSLDGERFAVAAGNRIQFYRHIGGTFVAEQLPDSHDAGAPVADLAYDEDGSLLVAVAGDNVLGFGPGKATPLWSFKATDASRGALDGPLRKVTLSDGGERLVVSGKTKFLAYTNTVAATAGFASAASTAAPARPAALALNVANTGSLPDNYTFVVKGPVGWTTRGPDNVALDPDGATQVNVTVEAPAGTAPGVYPVSVEVRSRASDNGVLATAQANLTIPRAVSVSLEAAEEKVTLRQGGDATVVLTVRNLGNAEGLVNLTATQATSQGSSWTVRFDKEQVRVAPGASADVRLTLEAPADATSGVRNVVTIRAKEGDVEAAEVVTAYVDPDFGAELLAANNSLEFRAGESRTLSVTLRNTGNTEDTYNVTYTLSPNIAAGDWKVTLAEDLKVTLAQGASRTLTVGIRPAVAEPRDASLTLRAVSQGAPNNDETDAVVLLSALPVEQTPDEDDDGNLLPAPSLLAVLVAVGAALLVLRRGGFR